MHIPHGIGHLKATELNPMPCHDLKAGSFYLEKLTWSPSFSNLIFPPHFPPSASRNQKASLSSLTVPSQCCTTSNWSA